MQNQNLWVELPEMLWSLCKWRSIFNSCWIGLLFARLI